MRLLGETTGEDRCGVPESPGRILSSTLALIISMFSVAGCKRVDEASVRRDVLGARITREYRDAFAAADKLRNQSLSGVDAGAAQSPAFQEALAQARRALETAECKMDILVRPDCTAAKINECQAAVEKCGK